MAKTVYANGSRAYAAWFNAIQNLVFDDQDIDGHYPRLTDDELSNAAGQIKQEWRTFRDVLKVTAGIGLSINHTGGAITLPNGAITTIAPGALALPDNSTSFVFISTTGVVSTAILRPVASVPLAQVTTVAGVVTAIVPAFPRDAQPVLPRAEAIRVFGGSGDQGDYLLTTTATFNQGEYYFRNFTIESAATLTISAGAKIHISGTCTINGTINVTTSLAGAGARTLAYANTIIVANPGLGSGLGGEVFGGSAYNYFLNPIGSSGANGTIFLTAVGTGGSGSKGGDAGGTLIFDCAGAFILGSTGSILARGGNAVVGTLGTSSGTLGGSGGGSGGLVLVKSLISITLQAGSTVDVRGGNGSNAVGGTGSSGSFGGGGGGGGHGAFLSPNNSPSGTILLTGGTAGTSTGTGYAGGGGGGFGGAGGSHQGAGVAGLLTNRTLLPVG
ncbi:hypothetical protein IQ268_08810 [Oculatella sp. LEGE 06141]|uniref:hypothetical protein n=1 Tax=Oculatella sp. LEGE 06141 TaxID=1828648 RepID=UPI0018825321|nr:hypothetical protein [Oculatella sp. LEGE 06141]MBE9178658.1 hypothetical protein [Oculatella sp. LEGE 06141]